MVAGLGTQLACWECGGRPGAGWRGPETLRGPVGCEAGGPPLRSLGCRGPAGRSQAGAGAELTLALAACGDKGRGGGH